MRLLLTVAICLGSILPLAAEAQTTRLPRKSTSERHVEELNRSIQQDRRIQSLEQDIQLKDGQIRQEIERQRMFSSPPIAAPRYGPCSPSAIRC